MPAAKDILYSIAFFSLFGACTMLARGVESFNEGSEYPLRSKIAISSFVMLLTCIWTLLFWISYKLYDGIRLFFASRSTLRKSNDEMAVLMGVVDDSVPATAYRIHEDPCEASNDPAHDPVQVISFAVQQTNDLLLNMYFVGSGVFFSVIAMGQLDRQCTTHFWVSIWLIAVRDCLARSHKIPDCKIQNAVQTIHQRSSWIETTTLVLLAVALSFSIYKTGELPTTTDKLIHIATIIACSAAPFLIWISPPYHHHVVTFETSLPMAGFMALAGIYAMSPIEQFLREFHQTQGAIQYLITVSLIFPFLILCMLYAFRKDFAIAVCCACSVWLLARETFMAPPNPVGWTTVAVGSTLMALIPTMFLYLLYYRKVHIVSQITSLRYKAPTNKVQEAHYATETVVAPPLPPP